MSATVWTMRVLIAGIETPCISARTSHGIDQPVGTCTLELPLPLPVHVVDGATVTVRVEEDGDELNPLFTGVFRQPERNLSLSGATATLLCEGNNYRLTYPMQADKVFAGGARVAASTLISTPVHLGTQTIAWYDDDSPVGIQHDVTATPSTDSSFVWITLDVHGSNSYDESMGDKKIKKWSKVEVRQDGELLGYANLPESNEQWSSELDYTDKDNWDEDEELFIAAAIDDGAGDVTFRFKSGYKPGTSTRDEYEVDDVTWQTAGRNTVREIIRGLYKRAGFALGTYWVNQITDLDGNVMYLGGNGLVDAGQVRIWGSDQPLAFIQRIAGLFGFKVFDCGDGTPRVLPVRGQPTTTAVASFTEGVDLFSVRRTRSVRDVYNKVRVEGASGNDQDGKRFEYLSETDDDDVIANEAIPDPPGVALLRITDSLLTSNALCSDVREIAEINHADAAVTIAFETWPHGIAPGRIIHVTAPTVDFTGKLFLTRITHDLSVNGFRCSIEGWAGASVPFDEVDDPDEMEAASEPTDPRRETEWFHYAAKSEVA